MKKLFIVVYFAISAISVKAQSAFEGFVNYKIQPMNPNSKLYSDSSFYTRIRQAYNGKDYTVQKYYYKQDKYKSELEAKGGSVIYQVYNSESNKLFNWRNTTSDTAVIINAQTNRDTVIDVKQIPEIEEVLGVKCRKLVFIYKSSQVTYWYNPDKYKIDYELYKNHNYGNWNTYLKIAGALPLKFEVKAKNFLLVTTAVEIKEIPISDTEFKLPDFKVFLESSQN